MFYLSLELLDYAVTTCAYTAELLAQLDGYNYIGGNVNNSRTYQVQNAVIVTNPVKSTEYQEELSPRIMYGRWAHTYDTITVKVKITETETGTVHESDAFTLNFLEGPYATLETYPVFQAEDRTLCRKANWYHGYGDCLELIYDAFYY